MNKYLEIFVEGYKGYVDFLWKEITHPSFSNYVYWLIAVSLFFFILEVVIPWRRKQKVFRKDFWLDVFYMFFNFFLFSLIIYNAASDVVVNLFNDAIKFISGGFDLALANPMTSWPIWSILLVGFIVRDFVQWWIHRLLHKSEWLWQFHKVHHSVEEMGFAAHLRYHWMENVVYRSLEYLPLALLGIGLHDFFAIHIFTLIWGHYNHSNISVNYRVTGGIIGAVIGLILGQNLLGFHLFDSPTYFTSLAVIGGSLLAGLFVLGPMMIYIFNSPEMHIWHHSYELPEDKKFGVNFGLTLSIWDYIFGTAYIPYDGKEIRLGFPGVETFPDTFFKQAAVGIADKNQKEAATQNSET